MQNVPLLYGAQCSRYSARVRSYLIKKGLQYVERVPSIWTYGWRIPRRFTEATMPVLAMPDGEWLVDSTLILDRLEASHPEAPVAPADPIHALFVALADCWGSEMWVPVDMGTRWTHTDTSYPWWREELGEGMFVGFPKVLKNAMCDRVAKMFSGYKSLLGITPEFMPQLEFWARGVADDLEAHFATHSYLLGERATRADFSLICPFYGHLVQDPWSRREILQPRPNLHAWVWRMQQPYLDGKAPPFPPAGSPLPATLTPIVARFFSEMLPYVEATLAELRRVQPNATPGTRLPRVVGEVDYPFGGMMHRRAGIPFILWMMQRVRDLLAAMPHADAERARHWLRENGGERVLELDIPRLIVVGGVTLEYGGT